MFKSRRPGVRRLSHTLLFLVAWSFMSGGGLRAQETKPAELTVAQIYEGARFSRKLLEALRVEYVYTTRTVNGNMPKDSQVAIGKWQMIFAYKDERRFSTETTVDTKPSPERAAPDTFIFDGKNTYVYRPGSLMIFEGKAENTDQDDTFCQEVLDIPVSDASRANHDNSWFYPHCLRPTSPAPNYKDYVVLADQEKVDGAWCHVIDCAGQLKLWVDPQIGFAPRRKELKRPGGGYLAEYSYTEFIEPVKGLWVPTRCTRLTSPFNDKTAKLQLLIEVKKLSVNDQVADSVFDLVVAPGTIVTGPGKGFVVQGDKTTMLDLSAGDVAVSQNQEMTARTRWLMMSLPLAAMLTAAVYWRSRSGGRKPLDGRAA